jgi:lactate dehydrogenase-like 2-hydroxyacid dehydrogenase
LPDLPNHSVDRSFRLRRAAIDFYPNIFLSNCLEEKNVYIIPVAATLMEKLMKPNVLMTAPMMPHVEAALDAAYTITRLWQADDELALFEQHGLDFTAVATGSHHPADGVFMDRMPNLEIISSFGVGVDHIDLEAAAARNIVVGNTPDVLNDDVANLAVALVMATSRQLVEWDGYVRAGSWVSEGNPPLARSIRDKTVGILGLGRIGKDIARKLEVFGCKIVYTGRTPQADMHYRFYSDLSDMAGASDFLIAICPGGEATYRIVNEKVLTALGPEGTFINVARGSVHDEEALVKALASGRLGAAGLDVFEDEPNVPEALLTMKNVVLQPHQGSATVETRKAMGDRVVDNLASYFAGNGAVSAATFSS